MNCAPRLCRHILRACTIATVTVTVHAAMLAPAMAQDAARAQEPFDPQTLASVLDCDDAAKWIDFIKDPPSGVASALKQGDIQTASFIPGDTTPGQYRFVRPVTVRGLSIQGFSAHLGMMPSPTLYISAPLDEVRRALDTPPGRFVCVPHGGPGGKGCEEKASRESQAMVLKLVFVQDKAMIPTGETMLACAGQRQRPSRPQR